MAGSRQYRSRENSGQQMRNHYMDGNTVRKERQDYEYVRVRTEQERKSYHVRRNWEKARTMTLPYVLGLVAAGIVVLLVSVQYLEARNDINASVRTISNLESDLEDLKEANSGLQKSIDSSTDLNYIYRIATEEMRMVPADESQIIRYDRTESEYVRQNEDIPTE